MSDSLKKRFSYKLSSNLVGMVCSLLVAGIVPRALGPASYGNFSFLTDFFNKVFAFFDAGTSTAFYTKLSQKPKRLGIIRFYKIFLGLVLILTAIITLGASFLGMGKTIWPNQELLYILMALGFAYLAWINRITSSMIDAFSLTSRGAIAKMIQKVIQVILIFILFSLGWFTLFSYFVFQYFILLILSISWILILKNKNIPFFPKRKLKKVELRSYLYQFYIYSKPLLIMALVSLVAGIFDRWLLQKFAGSVQQGFYGLSLRIASICFLFSRALIPLIMREFTIAHYNQDVLKLKTLFLNYVPLFFFIAAFISIFVSLHANEVGLIIGGSSFQNAGFSIMIMALYPILQTLGQFNGSFFMATNRTKLYGKIASLMAILSPIPTYLLIAPTNKYGLGLESSGLALKVVILSIIEVNIGLYFITKILGISFIKIILMQLKTIIFLIFVAFITQLIGGVFSDKLLVKFIISGIVYSTSIAVLIYRYPQLANITKDQKNKIVSWFIRVIKKIKENT